MKIIYYWKSSQTIISRCEIFTSVYCAEPREQVNWRTKERAALTRRRRC